MGLQALFRIRRFVAARRQQAANTRQGFALPANTSVWSAIRRKLLGDDATVSLGADQKLLV